MSGFDENIPQSIATLEKSIRDLYVQISILDWGHECDCTYCTEQSDAPEDTIKENDRLTKEINDYKATISSLRGFAKLKGVEL
jgi:hypothetical protein